MDEPAKTRSDMSLEERLKAVSDKIAKLKGKPKEAERMPKLQEREKSLRAKIAGQGGKKT